MNVIHETLSPRRQRSRAKRTARIIEAAMSLVADNGFDALTMGQLADQLDVSAGSLYRYFASKDALVVALQARAIARIHEMLLQERVAWQSSLPTARAPAALCELVGVASFYCSLAGREPRIFRLVHGTLADPRTLVADEHARGAAEPFGALLAAASELFATAAANGALSQGSALQRTVLLWTALHGVMMVNKLDRLAPSEGEASDVFKGAKLSAALTSTLLRGWGAKDDHLEQAICWLEARRDNHTSTNDKEDT